MRWWRRKTNNFAATQNQILLMMSWGNSHIHYYPVASCCPCCRPVGQLLGLATFCFVHAKWNVQNVLRPLAWAFSHCPLVWNFCPGSASIKVLMPFKLQARKFIRLGLCFLHWEISSSNGQIRILCALEFQKEISLNCVWQQAAGFLAEILCQMELLSPSY